MDYVARIIDPMVTVQLAAAGAVVIRGPKGCGKTETGRHHSHSELDVEDSPHVRAAMAADPRLLLHGETPRLIDEWQLQPSLWDTVRREVDQRRTKGQFILTGSATPREQATGTGAPHHSGVGRFGLVDMRTMSWRELGWSTGSVPLAGLMAGGAVEPQHSDLDLETVANRLVIGGWPGNLGLARDAAQTANANYVELLATSDAASAWGIRRDQDKLWRTLQSLARNVSTECSLATLAADAAGADARLADETVSEYLQVFHALMVEEDVPAWNTHIRSSARLRKRAKRHLADPSLCCAALGLTAPRLLADLEYFGLLFESAAIHDLRVYASALRGRVSHYRDSNGVEADAVVELPDGTWAAFEVKLGFGATDDAAASLARFAATIDSGRVGPPAALTVITASGIAHTRPDGIHVVPLACLG
ncbi:MAG: ATP-binding protein [Bifidobacteriaceae bacterium]|jgi:predicted AAA+ superfamily ATPase|nr:ATP-binding protein [Bifidobacteriaceae bacterium]